MGVYNENLRVFNEIMEFSDEKFGVSNENLGSLTKIWECPMKISGYPTGIWRSPTKKYGLFNKNLGVSNENMGSPTKIWGLQRQYEVSN